MAGISTADLAWGQLSSGNDMMGDAEVPSHLVQSRGSGQQGLVMSQGLAICKEVCRYRSSSLATTGRCTHQGHCSGMIMLPHYMLS